MSCTRWEKLVRRANEWFLDMRSFLVASKLQRVDTYCTWWLSMKRHAQIPKMLLISTIFSLLLGLPWWECKCDRKPVRRCHVRRCRVRSTAVCKDAVCDYVVWERLQYEKCRVRWSRMKCPCREREWLNLKLSLSSENCRRCTVRFSI